ncbi:nitronate monooxygenase [Pusillimonas caeni]|uniref:NAD(P)H-dependent flavin oxidoreductase n=1 Tax=Pusillimonas caeni TaxID=1348472 RepID=UPI000E59AFBF|nr:nitronate monooxygenase [Pusillimonas caeni]TFL13329.1 nitronate monooxygenase [Pusillimonas caeni]
MITTPFTESFDLRHPIVLGPMGGVAGGRLAAAVSNAGGLGLVGGGYGDLAWLKTELALAKELSTRPWGAGFITWNISEAALELVLEARPSVLMLSFGDPGKYAATIKAADCRLICQVQDVAGARLAQAAGADVIVAQGTEGGGHGGSRATMALLPAVVDAVSPTPVLAAGGIADGRGLAAALMLGAQGVLLGTRFYATREALGHDQAKQRIVQGQGDATQRTRVFDIVRGYDWPAGYTGRALRNRFIERWEGREEELARGVDIEGPAFWAAAADGDYDVAMVWAGEAIDLIDSIPSAAEVVEQVSAQAELRLRSAAGLLE